jgi:dUTP pyrophosphatase
MNESRPPLIVSVKLLHPAAKLPARKSANAAGWDIYCLENFSLWSGIDRETVRTGIAMAIPHGYYGHIVGRSGLAKENGITIMGGIIDSDYRGEIHVIVCNTGETDVKFAAGDRIAQMIFHAHYDAAWMTVDELPPTDRGEGGLGSTGR